MAKDDSVISNWDLVICVGGVVNFAREIICAAKDMFASRVSAHRLNSSEQKGHFAAKPRIVNGDYAVLNQQKGPKYVASI